MGTFTGTGGADVVIGGPNADTLEGFEGNDWLQALGGNDTLIGDGGRDALWGGSGFNVMYGGDQSDTYVVYGSELLIEDSTPTSGSADRILSYVDFDMSADGQNIEVIRLVAHAATSAIGNDLDNTMEGNDAVNTLTGGLGNDTYIIHGFEDVLVEGAAEGTHDALESTVTVSLAGYTNIEDIVLDGKAAINATGDAGDNVLDGHNNTAKNILTGGFGNDTYVIDKLDTIVENAGGGTDTVKVDFSYSLATHATLENITLTGTVALNATGNTGVNVLTGNDGANTLDGATGADTMIGGKGSDTYIVDNSSDLITEVLGEGTDTVKSSVSFDLGVSGINVEKLILTGTGNINGTGNAIDNSFSGTSGTNILSGAGGNDTLSGLAGNDTLDGGIGNDTLDGGTGTDSFIGGAGDDTFIIDNSVENVTELLTEGTDTIRSTASYDMSLHAANVEKLVLLGVSVIGIGNSFDNQITGSNASNTLSGGDGNDTVDGGIGNDLVNGDNGNDTLTGAGGNDVLNGGSGDDSLIGGLGNDTLFGGIGNDTLDSGIEKDTMIGGTGNDTYLVRDGSTLLVENAGEGTDTVNAYTSYTLAANIENMLWVGGAGTGTGNSLVNIMTGNGGNNNLLGMAGNDTLTGFGGNDTLDGGAGADTMIGGTGNDTFVVDDVANDTITENAGEGTDTVQTGLSYSLATHPDLENITLTGALNVDATGNAAVNVLTGNGATNTLNGDIGDDTLNGGGGNDVLNGGADKDTLDGGDGVDTLQGGLGDDTYIVDTSTDSIGEALNEGTDLVKTSVDFTLGTNVENLTLTGIAKIGNGNALANTITGNSGVNTLAGGDGNDTYIIDSRDIVIEGGGIGSGIDTVNINFAGYVLGANIENITLTGALALNATGSSAVNILTGNDADNTLDGSTGADTLIGANGNDIFIVDNAGDVVTELAGQGTDTIISSIDFDLGLNGVEVENLTLSGAALIGKGSAVDNVLTGDDLVNTLTGLGGNDMLDGGLGADSLIGGTGNDVYIVDNAGDLVTEVSGEGIDTINSSVTYNMLANAAEVENLVLTGGGAINATGNTLDNTMTGNSGANLIDGGTGNDVLNGGGGDDTLVGGIGNDTLDGGTGNNTLFGGVGDDTYVVASTTNIITENLGEGTDVVKASINYTLGANIENLTLTGSAISGVGNSLSNLITGNGGNNTLDGGIGGVDTLAGGAGNDSYIINAASDIITEGIGAGTDTAFSAVTYTIGTNVENLTLTGTSAIDGTGNTGDNTLTGNSAANVLSGGDGNDTYIIDNLDTVVEAAGQGTKDTVLAGFSYTLTAEVENLMLTGTAAINGTGNALDNTITGNSGINTLTGGDGNDVYVIDVKDTIFDSLGTDTIKIGATYSLAAHAGFGVENLTLTGTGLFNAIGDNGVNVLTGNDAKNTLDGLLGADTLIGGLGDDTYLVHDATTSITEVGGQGTDTVISDVTFTLAPNIENLTLIDKIAGVHAAIDGTGNGLANIIKGTAGDNILNGGLGADTMDGGAGNDTYYVDNASDVIKDTSGLENVHTTLSVYTLGTGLENLFLDGGAVHIGTGNTAANSITGGDGNDTIDGGTGADHMMGGKGDDIYFVDVAGDVVFEASGEGQDTIKSKISFDLSTTPDVENLTLTGTSGNGTGNDLDNIITGNSGANTLIGGIGDDTLIGGGGRDVLDGGAGRDTFEFDQDTAYKGIVTIHHYDVLGGDTFFFNGLLNLDPLLEVDDDYREIRTTADPNISTLWVDQDGTGSQYHFVQIAILDIN